MSAFCLPVGVRLLAYGALAGGLLTEKWHGKAEPRSSDIADWSTMKYLRFVERSAAGMSCRPFSTPWRRSPASTSVSIGNVATRWVLEQEAVAGVIVGARLGEREHRADNLKVFDFALDAEDDRSASTRRWRRANRIPGDCGDEYRRPPFLTASGDLSHHLARLSRKSITAEPMPERPDRSRVDTGSIWEPLAGLQPRRSRRRPHPGQRHDGHSWRR